MPEYCFFNKTKRKFETLLFSYEELKEMEQDDGLYRTKSGDLLERDYGRESGGFPDNSNFENFTSEAMGVHPSQVRECNHWLQRHGITGARYLPNGCMKIDGYRERKKVMKLLQVHDNQGYY